MPTAHPIALAMPAFQPPLTRWNSEAGERAAERQDLRNAPGPEIPSARHRRQREADHLSNRH